MSESVKIKSERQSYCTICGDVVCNSDTVVVTADILELFKFLIQDIDTSIFQDANICGTCLIKIKEAFKFKTFYTEKQQTDNVEIKQETDCDKNFVTICYICKITIIDSCSMPLCNSLYEDVLNYLDCLTSKGDLKKLNPQICNSCQISMLNFQNIIQLLLDYDCNADSNKVLKTGIKIEYEDMSENDTKGLPENVCIINKLKKEVKEDEKIDAETVESYQFKHEELDLKMDCEPGPSEEGVVMQNEEDPNDSYDNEGESMEVPGVFKCNSCLYQTTTKRNWKNHILKHKNIDEVEPFKCTVCPFQTRYKHGITKHKITHKIVDEADLFKCLMCKFMTKHKPYLEEHMLVHNSADNIKMFKCPYCKFSTKYKKALTLHNKNNHTNNIEIKLFNCNVCEFQTKYKSSLRNHMILHEKNKFKCDQCQFQTIKKCALVDHSLLHKSNKTTMYKCNVCGIQTDCRFSYIAHMTICNTPGTKIPIVITQRL